MWPSRWSPRTGPRSPPSPISTPPTWSSASLLEIGALVAYTQLTHAVLPPGGPRRLRLFRINLSTLSLSHVAPGGTAPGAALGYRLLTQSGVTSSDAGFALGTQGIGSAVVLNVIFWLALVGFLAVHGFHVPAEPAGWLSLGLDPGHGGRRRRRWSSSSAFGGLLWLAHPGAGAGPPGGPADRRPPAASSTPTGSSASSKA